MISTMKGEDVIPLRGIFTLDKLYNYVSFDEEHAAGMLASGSSIGEGTSFLGRIQNTDFKTTFQITVDRIFRGAILVGQTVTENGDGIVLDHIPVYGPKGQIVAVTTIARTNSEDGEELPDDKAQQKNKTRPFEEVNTIVQDLTLQSALQNSTLDAFIKRIIKEALHIFGCDWCGYWEFDDNQDYVSCKAWKGNQQLILGDNHIVKAEFPNYFVALERQRIIAADDALTDIRTNELIETYLKKNQIASSLDAAIVGKEGKVIGILCIESRTKRSWSEQDCYIMNTLAGILSNAHSHDAKNRANNRLLLVQKMADVMTLVYDIKKQNVACSNAIYDFFGYTAEAYTDKYKLLKKALHQNDFIKMEAWIEEAMATNKKLLDPIQLRAYGKTGKPLFLHAVGTLEEDTHDQSPTFLLMVQNVTQNVINTKSLNEAQQIAKLGCYRYTIDNDELLHSENSLMILGLTENHSKRLGGLLALVHPDFKAEMTAYFQDNVLKGGNDFDKEFKILDPTLGTEKWIHGLGKVKRDEKGRPKLMYGTFQDITKRKEADAENARLNKITHSQNQILKNFAHIVSHNLRSHSGNFLMLLQILESSSPEILDNEYFNMTKKAAGNLHETLEDLSKVVDIYVSEENQMEGVALRTAVARNIESLTPTIKETQSDVKNLVPPNLMVYGVPAYLGSVTLNLLTNALKYRDPKRESKITINAQEDGSLVKLYVEDNGLGIDLVKYSNDLFKIFTTFHGNDDATGVGLFITKNQVEAMGGEISVESEVGKGSTFCITLKKFTD